MTGRTDETAPRKWDANSAAAWHKWFHIIEDGAQALSDRMVELAAIGPGSRALDVASGVGEPAVVTYAALGVREEFSVSRYPVTALDERASMSTAMLSASVALAAEVERSSSAKRLIVSPPAVFVTKIVVEEDALPVASAERTWKECVPSESCVSKRHTFPSSTTLAEDPLTEISTESAEVLPSRKSVALGVLKSMPPFVAMTGGSGDVTSG